MSNPASEKPWSIKPNAPQISYYWYFEEKTNYAGIVISTMFYGIVIAQFFQCMSALLNRSRRDIKWGLVAHTVMMFSCVTIYTAGGLYLQSISYIDDRGFPGVDTIPPGPIGYQFLVITDPSFYAISVSLNVILTLMIVARLILHNRNIRNALETSQEPGGLYGTIVTMLIESCAIYAVTYLLYIGPWSTKNSAQLIFSPILTVAQVIGPLLIIQRVANQTALTSNAIISGNIGSFHFKSHGELTVGDEALPDGSPVSPVTTDGETPGELGIETESIHTIKEVASVR